LDGEWPPAENHNLKQLRTKASVLKLMREQVPTIERVAIPARLAVIWRRELHDCMAVKSHHAGEA
jgi:hypothetical protein